MTADELFDQTTEEASRLGDAIDAATRRLSSLQHPDGHWCGELQGDTILESEYLLLLHYLGRAHEDRFRKGAEYVRRQQLPDAGWAIYEGGPTDLSSSVKAYFVLKMSGDAPDAPHMAGARRRILGMGGIEACHSFTKIYLSIFRQFEWSKCPAVPPELILLPDWFVFNIYKISYSSRCIILPLSIIWAFQPTCDVHCSIDELRCPSPSGDGGAKRRSGRERFWRAFFNALDAVLKMIESIPLKPLRRRALAKPTPSIADHP